LCTAINALYNSVVVHLDSFTLRVVVAPPFFEVDILSEASAVVICREVVPV